VIPHKKQLYQIYPYNMMWYLHSYLALDKCYDRQTQSIPRYYRYLLPCTMLWLLVVRIARYNMQKKGSPLAHCVWAILRSPLAGTAGSGWIGHLAKANLVIPLQLIIGHNLLCILSWYNNLSIKPLVSFQSTMTGW
jgi:hypothetical protein